MSEQHDALHERGRRSLLAQDEIWDVPPTPRSPRWGVALVLWPDGATAERLAALTSELSAAVGPAHWPTGSLGSAHLTIRSLEPYRDPVPRADPAVRRYTEAASRAGHRAGPAHFAMTGLLLMPGGVLAVAEPRNASARGLRARVARELGEDGHFEDDDYRGDVWWATLLHFAAPLEDPQAVIDWVDERRTLDLGDFHAEAINVVRYQYDGVRTAPVRLAVADLTGPGT